jgi:hypothetical protein
MKKYPAVSGYFMQNKREPQKEGPKGTPYFLTNSASLRIVFDSLLGAKLLFGWPDKEWSLVLILECSKKAGGCPK